MAPSFLKMCRWWLTIFLVAIGNTAMAADVTVRGSLSRGITVIGDPVQYQIKISGARRTGEPPQIEADGLSIRYAGPTKSSIMRFQNGNFISEQTTTWIYQVMPEKNGSFTIPAMTVEADGKNFRTEPVGLTVQPSSAAGTDDPKAVGFAEFVVPRKTAYLGEAIPVELRLYVDARIRWQPVAMPEIAGEGFTKQKMPEPERQQAQRNGRDYDVLVFKTVITPSRAGKITLGPSTVPYNARVPRARRNSPRSLFDMFDDDVFSDPFFSAVQQLKAAAEEVKITVEPLPVAGKPVSFSGAVGKFQFTAEGRPNEVKIGDPVTMKLRVTGRGNFDRMTAPPLADSDGWRAYPPSSTFKGDDEIGYDGTKTFDVVVVPEAKKTQMPVFEFSFFDPDAQKYVSLRSERLPLTVEGNVIPPPPPPALEQEPGKETPAAAQRAEDIVGLRYDRGAAGRFAPLYTQRYFWYAQGGMGAALLGLLALRLRRQPDEATRRLAELQREKARAWSRLRDAKLSDSEFMNAAAQLAQVETALATGRPAASIDAPAVCAAASLSEESQAAIEAVFSTRAHLLYAGDGSPESRAPAAERSRIVAALEELGKGRMRN